jgi:uncharacterized protein YndB with AHSA1/START domain
MLQRLRRGTRIKVRTTIDAPPKVVWAAIDDVTTHTTWMADAVVIRITSDKTSGVGTTFDCDTQFGPFRLLDRMEITRWSPGKAMGVRHVGLVRGEGEFTLRKRRGATRFTWDERLFFPWWMGGRIGGIVGRRIIRRVWKKNLRRLRDRIESGTGG